MTYNQGPYYSPPGPYPPGPQLPSNATAVYVVTVLNFVVSPILAPVGWYLASQELQAIDERRADPTHRNNVFVCRIVNIVMTCVFCVAMTVFVGFMVLAIVLPLVMQVLR